MTAPDGHSRGFWSSPAGFAFTVLLAVGAVLLWLEHRAHVLGILPLLLPLLICGAMHLFMHRGRGGHHHGGDDER